MLFNLIKRQAIKELRKKNYDEAYQLFQKASEFNQEDNNIKINIILIEYFKKSIIPEEAIKKLLAIVANSDNDLFDIYLNVGYIYQELKKYDDSLLSYKTAYGLIQKNEVVSNIVNLLNEIGSFSEALSFIKKHDFIYPPDTNILNNIGNTYKGINDYKNAINYYKKSIETDVKNFIAMNNLGLCLAELGDYKAAILAYEYAIAINPYDLDINRNYADSFFKQGEVNSAIQVIKSFKRINKLNFSSYTNLLLYKIYSNEAAISDFKNIAEECAYFERLKINDKLNNKKVGLGFNKKIGFISPDFNKHPVSYHIIELLQNLKQNHGYQIHFYHNSVIDDEITKRYIKFADKFTYILNYSDESVSQLIRNDNISILIDLAGYTAGSRLPVLLHESAPLQLSYLGYPATTGMKEVDFRITDNIVDPIGFEDQYTEKLFRMPDVYCCYSNLNSDIHKTIISPYKTTGFITFGIINNYAKLTDEMIVICAEILSRIPNSKLLIEIANLSNDGFKIKIIKRFEKFNIYLNSLILINRAPENQFILYNKIDICLDTFPCNGGTSSCDSLWMGVPLISLAGKRNASRMGASFLTHIGLSNLISFTKDEYIKKATELAGDHDMLDYYRKSIAMKMQNSLIMNSMLFADKFSDALLQMWDLKFKKLV